MIKFRRHAFGAFGLLGGALAVSAVACGSSFDSGDCRTSRTCAPSSAGARDPLAGDAGSPGSPESGEGGGGSVPDGATGAGAAGGEASAPLEGDAGAAGQGQVIAVNPPPTVLSVAPDGAEQNVEPETTVTVSFSEPLAATTVDESSVKLLDRGQEVAGTVAYVDSTVTFTPALPLALLGDYSISITTDVTDVEGAPLAETFESSFQVRDGKFYVNTAVDEDVHEMASSVPVESTGAVLLAWIDRGDGAGYECPVLYQRFLRGAELDSPRPLSAESATSCAMLTARTTPNGITAVSWAQHSGSPHSAHVRQYRDGNWSVDAAPAMNNEDGLFSLGLASSGMVSLFENRSNASYAYRTDLAGKWATQPDNLGATGSAVAASAVAFDDAGDGLAVWQASKSNVEQLYFSRFATTSGKWATAALLPGSKASQAGAGYERGVPALAADPQGNAVALWLAAAGDASTPKLMASHFDPSSGWAAPLSIGATWSEAPVYDPPALVFDGETFVAAFTAHQGSKLQTLVTRFDAAQSAWSTPEERQAPGDPNSVTRMPKLATDGRGHLILVWAGGVGPSYKFYYQRYANDTWGATKSVPDGVIEEPQFPLAAIFSWSLASNADGLAALSWTGDDGRGLQTRRIRLASFY